MIIERVDNLDARSFLTRYVERNQPVVVTDALREWRLAEVWTPDYLCQHFGRRTVQVYNDGFDLTNLISLSDYCGRYFGHRAASNGHVPYVRWYSKLRDVDFAWADDVFAAIRGQWDRPSFMPDTGYLLPFAPAPRTVNPAEDLFPARGLFISGAGARTGLHVDPWGSDALLCQVYGQKTWLMYGPEQASALSNGTSLVDPDHPDHAAFPGFSRIEPRYEFTIGPGDTVYVPQGWFHHVRSDTDAISLTWNFVHASTADHFVEWIDHGVSDLELSIVRFFLRDLVDADASPADVREAVCQHLRSSLADGTRSAATMSASTREVEPPWRQHL
jgi:hypothetical protein